MAEADDLLALNPVQVYVYEHATSALTECSRIDECAKWAIKAEALASYAKQADDDSLRKLADRIQARAIRRCGELLRQIKSPPGGQPSHSTRGDDAVGGRSIAFLTDLTPSTTLGPE